MLYMLLIYSQETENGPPHDVAERTIQAHQSLMDDARNKGVLRGLAALKSTASATTVRIRGGKSITLDGPFAETKEQLAGYYLLDCENLDEALEWAKRVPSSCRGGDGCVEVRPVSDFPPPMV
jgi:hypothetical protein